MVEPLPSATKGASAATNKPGTLPIDETQKKTKTAAFKSFKESINNFTRSKDGSISKSSLLLLAIGGCLLVDLISTICHFVKNIFTAKKDQESN